MAEESRSEDVRGLFAILAGSASVGKEAFQMLLHDLLRTKVDVFRVLAYSVLTLLFQAASLILIFSYIAALESHQPITLASFEYMPTASLTELIISGLIAAVLVFLSALIALYARRVTVLAGLKYYRRCLKRAVIEIRTLAVHEPDAFSRLPISTFRGTLSGDVRYASAAYTQLISSFLPIITLLAAIAALFVLAVELGLVTLISLLIFLPVYALLFRSGQSLQEDLRDAARDNARDKTDLLEVVLQDAASNVPNNPEWLNARVGMGITARFLKLLGRRQQLSDYATVVANLGIALATAGFIVYVGYSMDSGGAMIANVAIVLLLFRYMLSAFNTIISRITNLYAMLPLFARLHALQELTSYLAQRVTQSPEHGQALWPEQGLAILYTKRETDISLLADVFGNAMLDDGDLVLLGPAQAMLDMALRVGEGSLLDVDTYLSEVPGAEGREQDVRRFYELLENDPDREDVRTIPREVAVLIAYARLQESVQLILIREDDLANLQPVEREWLLDSLGSRLLILVAKNGHVRQLSYPLKAAVIDTQQGLTAVQPAANRTELDSLLARVREKPTLLNPGAEMDPDEEFS